MVATARASIISNREEDQTAHLPLQTICETYTTPEDRRVNELSKQIEDAKVKVEEGKEEEQASIVPLTLDEEVEKNLALIKEQEAYLEPVEQLKAIVAPSRAGWMQLLADGLFKAEDSATEGKPVEAALLELQSSGRGLRRRPAKGSAGTDTLSATMQALVDAVKVVMEDSEAHGSEISDAVDKARQEHEVTLSALKLKQSKLMDMEDGLLDKGLEAKASAQKSAVEIEQLEQDLEKAQEAQASSFNMCKSYQNEFDEREVKRKTVEGLIDKMAELGETTKEALEKLLDTSCCPCGDTCDGLAECSYCGAAEELSQGTPASSTDMQFASLAMVSDVEAEGVQAEMEALLKGN